MIRSTLKLPRKTKQLVMMLFDAIAVILCLFLGFYIRLGYWYYPSEGNDVLIMFFASPLLAFPIFYKFNLYQEMIRYVGIKALWLIIKAVSLFSIMLALVSFMANIDGTPRSVIVISWLLAILVIGGSRLFARWLFVEKNLNNNLFILKKVLIYGAGSAGRQLATALLRSDEYKPLAFIDDDKTILQKSIGGLYVYSKDDLEDLINKKQVKEILIAIPSLTRNRRNEIINDLKKYQVAVRSLPGVSALAQGKVRVHDLLEIDINDLLGRKVIRPNKDLLKTNVYNKVVLVTGAGGSIGSELCRQILLLQPKKLVLYEISESSLYQIEQELINFNDLNIEIVPVIGSIIDKDRFQYICNYYDVSTIYHAAAYKHVPLVEYNQSQGVLNNTFGTLLAAEAAIASNVETFVLISTDKAVRPTNVMGASKRGAELILQAFDKLSHKTCFTIVRFGNVLDSSGSVIPLFKRQIKQGGPVTVTHTDIVRYFMTIPEAVELVIQAGAMAKGGEVFVLDMGEPIRIYDLAVKMIELSGLQVRDNNNPDGDIDIQYTGLRPGEKLYEELLVGGKFTYTKNKLIMCAEEEMISWDKLEPILKDLKESALNTQTDKLYLNLKRLIPEFNSKFKL